MSDNLNGRKGIKIKSIQIIRALSCLFVVLCHTQGTEFGQTGVDFFLVISGFVMMLSTDSFFWGGVDHYWKKRIKRVVPLYYAITVFTSLLVFKALTLFHSYEVSVEYFIKSILFIPYYHNGIPGPIMELGWTLNYEVFFYLIFWISMKISHRYRGIICGMFIVAYCSIGKLVALPTVFDYWSKSIIFEFVIGIVGFYIWQITRERVILDKKNRRMVSIIAGFSFISAIFLMEFLINLDIVRSLSVGLVAGTVVVGFSVFDEAIINNKWLALLGETSYEIYLIHPFVVRGYDLIFNRFIGHTLFSSIVVLLLSLVTIEFVIWIWRKGFSLLRLKR